MTTTSIRGPRPLPAPVEGDALNQTHKGQPEPANERDSLMGRGSRASRQDQAKHTLDNSQAEPELRETSHNRQPTAEPAHRNRATRRAALVEDAEWMAQTGETTPGAAARLHLRPGTLRESLKRAGRPDLWARLVANADQSYPITGTTARTTTRRAA